MTLENIKWNSRFFEASIRKLGLEPLATDEENYELLISLLGMGARVGDVGVEAPDDQGGGDMKPGKEFDILVAEKVMGWKREMGMLHGKPQEVFTDGEGSKRSVACGCDEDFNPSNDIAAAWEVEAKIGEGYDPNILSDHAPNQRVYRYLEELHKLVGHPIDYDTSFDDEWALLRATPYQRCLAALKAFGVEVPS